jgi:hypothetical protein
MQSGFYSFVVHALRELVLPEHRLVLDPGMNAFNLIVPNVDEFLRTLADMDVTVKRVHPLDVQEEFDVIPTLPTTAQADPSGDSPEDG